MTEVDMIMQFGLKDLSIPLKVNTGDGLLFFSSSRLIVSGEYYFELKDSPKCNLCNEYIVQFSACGNGTGTLYCDCSVWESSISPFSGSAHPTTSLKRTSKLTVQERIGRALRSKNMTQKEIALVCCKGGHTPSESRQLQFSPPRAYKFCLVCSENIDDGPLTPEEETRFSKLFERIEQ